MRALLFFLFAFTAFAGDSYELTRLPQAGGRVPQKVTLLQGQILQADANGKLQPVALSGGGDALTANPLSQFAATTSAQLRGVMSDESGSGALVFAGGNIGAATATSVNGLTLSASTGTLTITNLKTFTVSNTLTLAGSDGSTLNIGNGGTLGTGAFANIGDYLTTAAAAAGYQPLDSDLTSIAALATTSYGRSFLTQADASAGRSYMGLGSLATQSGTFSGGGTLATGGNTLTVAGTASITGTNTGDQTSVTGSAGTLNPGRNINGTLFDGSTNITITVPVATGVTGLGTGVASALAVNTGTAGAFVVNGGALGTPSSGLLTNATGLPIDTGLTIAGQAQGDVLYHNGTNWTRLAAGTSGQFLKTQGAGANPTWAAGGSLSGTGSVDNAILRADGTGGSTLQSSDLTIGDASTTTTNQVAITNVHSGQTNSALVLSPKGTGALISGPPPDGTSTGGNARGTNAIDLQNTRGSATQVASGASTVVIGSNSTASITSGVAIGTTAAATTGSSAVAIGTSATAAATSANAIGTTVNASASGATAIGFNASASAQYGVALGAYTAMARSGRSYASGRFATNGDAQVEEYALRCKTTTNTAVEMALDGSTSYLTIASGRVLSGYLTIVGTKSDGSAVAVYKRHVTAINQGGTTTLVDQDSMGSTDVAAGTTLSITANNTSDYLSIQVTGITSETWRWTATFNGSSHAYGN